MARNLTEARQYLVRKIREMAKPVLKYPVQEIEVIFRDKGGVFATAHADADSEGNIIRMWMSIDDKVVRANILNIENPMFLDVIRHEISHLKDYEKHAKTHTRFGHGPRFRQIYKEHFPGHESGLARGFASGSPLSSHEDKFIEPEKALGTFGYGYASPETLDATLRICTSCGDIGVYKPARKSEHYDPHSGYWRCSRCGGKLMTVKRLSQREFIDHSVMMDKYGESEMQDHLRKKYAGYLSKLPYRHRAKVKRQVVKKKLTLSDRIHKSMGTFRIKI